MLKDGCYFRLAVCFTSLLLIVCSAQTTTSVLNLGHASLQIINASNLTTSEQPTTTTKVETNTTAFPSTTITTFQPLTATVTATTTLNSSTTTSSISQQQQQTKTDLFEQVAVYVVSFFLIFGGVVPYIPQYKIISKTCNAHGFSSYVCLTIFVSSILRILFWFGHKFEPALLIQSVVMILGTLVMLELCVRVDRERLPPDERNKKITDLNPMHFWKWTNFSSYLIFLSIIVVVLSLLTSLLVSYKVYVEIIGFISVIAEILLSVPQFYRNYENKSTLGMSVSMIFLWILGDFSKTTYFIIRKSPIQFVICGCLQILINMAIIGQAMYYAPKNKTTTTTIDVSAYNLMRY